MNIFKINNKLYIYSIFLILLLLTITIFLNFIHHEESYILPKENSSNNTDYTDDSDDINNDNPDINQSERLIENIEAYKNNQLLVLTFDDGPGNYTEYLVDELKKRDIKVTFFILGCNIEGKENILLKSSIDNEIAIHSFSHKLFTKLSNEEIMEDIELVKAKIFEITKKEPTVIRVPYGSLNARVKTLLFENGYTNIKWDIDSKDWHFRNTDKTFNYTMKYIKGNSIILMHDIYKTSVDSALKLVDCLKDEYKFVTISEFLEAKTEYEKIYKSN